MRTLGVEICFSAEFDPPLQLVARGGVYSIRHLIFTKTCRRKRRKDDYMICGMPGKRLWYRIVLVEAPCHRIPHLITYAIRLLRVISNAILVIWLAWLLGHSSVRTTQVYVQPTEEEIIERVSQIDLNAYAD
jgi:hypothetical protein